MKPSPQSRLGFPGRRLDGVFVTSAPRPGTNAVLAAEPRSDIAVADEIETLLIRNPGLMEAEIATTLFGEAGYPARVARALINLMKSRRIERSGRGGRFDPFRYFPKGQLTADNPLAKRRRYVAEFL